MRRRRTKLLVCAVCLIAATPGALAAEARPTPRTGGWPDGTVRYYDASDWPRTVAAAAARWSRDLRVRFVAVRRRSEAQLIIISRASRQIVEDCPHDDGRGLLPAACAQIGYVPGRVSRVTLPRATAYQDRNPTPADLRLVEHELGHVLGEHHLHGCAVMNPNVDLQGCTQPMTELTISDRLQRWLCGPFPADVRALAGIYGVRSSTPVDPYCVLPGVWGTG